MMRRRASNLEIRLHQPCPVLRINTTLRKAYWQDTPVVLGDRAFDLLVLLARCPGEPVLALALHRALWHGRRVDPANLRVQISALRKQLGRDAVQTVFGTGYRLTVPMWPLLPLLPDRPLLPSVPALAVDAPSNSGPLTRALPVPCDPLIGRDSCVQQLLDQLRKHRFVCVLGPGGIGKTRVALEVARRLRDDKSTQPYCGVLWADLALIDVAGATTALICRAVADAGALQWGGAGEAKPAYHLGLVIHQALQGQAALLVLDNAEHLAEAVAALLPTLQAAAPTLRVLVTSQHVLPAAGGQAHWLQALPVPPAGASEKNLRASPAVQLLLHRAQALHPQWQPQAADWPAIGALARALDGLALALELAAPRLPLLGAQALLARLSDHLQQPNVSGAAVPPRQRTLRAALDWSHALLSAPEQAALRQLGMFAAPFRIDAAVSTVAIEGLDDAGVERAIQGLVERSLLQLLPAGPHGAPVRLRLAETTRLYALQSLRQQGPDAVRACSQRHGRALAALARQACADFLTAADAAWSARWLPDHDDFQTAFDNAHERGDADVAADTIEALVLGANITGRTEPALQRWRATRVLAEGAAPLARAKLLGWGNLAQVGGSTRLMQSQQRLQAWRQVPGEAGRRGLCVALAMHALVCQDACHDLHPDSGDPGAADTALAECLALESPDWPPRLRRRCGWIALTRLAIARDDDTLLAAAGRLSTRLAAELLQQGAWREHTLVQGQQALMLRLRGRSSAAADLLAQAAHTQLQLGCGLDAGRSLALQCAALAEQPEAAEAADVGGPPPAAERWHEARPVAARALALLAPYPAQILHFAEALADFAGRQGEPEMAVQLLSGAAQMRQAQQLGRDRLTDHAAARAWQQARPALDAATLERCARQGRELSAEALRTLALRWLTTGEGTAPGSPIASRP